MFDVTVTALAANETCAQSQCICHHLRIDLLRHCVVLKNTEAVVMYGKTGDC